VEVVELNRFLGSPEMIERIKAKASQSERPKAGGVLRLPGPAPAEDHR
jgi:hypothetical protein